MRILITVLLSIVIIFTPLQVMSQAAPTDNGLCSDSKIKSTITILDSSPKHTIWVDDNTILILTKQNKVWRSADGGHSFTNIIPTLGKEAEKTITTGKLVGSGVFRINQNKINHQMLFLIGFGQYSWYTDNGGASFHQLRHPDKLWRIFFHPVQPGLWAALSGTSACYSNTQGDQCYTELSITTDFGKTWAFRADHIVFFHWFKQTKGAVDAQNKNLAFWTQTHSTTPNAWVKKPMHLYSSTDLLVTNSTLLTHVTAFTMFHDAILASQAVSGNTNANAFKLQLRVSQDKGASFSTAQIPTDLKNLEYSLLDASSSAIDAAAVIHVDHHNPGAAIATGNVYTSDSTLSRYSLSLSDNVRVGHKADFASFENLEGVFLANVVRDNAIQTRFSVDLGDEWNPIKKPKNAKCPDGGSDCNLHLHLVRGQTDIWDKVYSTKAAIGMMLGTGNLGPSLEMDAAKQSIFLTRDGGINWSKVVDGAYHYEFGNHGSLIIMSSATQSGNELVYSWTQGNDWQRCRFNSEAVKVTSIRSSPNGKDSKFILIGTGNDGKDVIVGFDFSDFHERVCTKNDFETWIPDFKGLRSGLCLLGREVQFTRRKHNSKCRVTTDYEPPKTIKNCECTDNDYECDSCYERNTLFECVRTCEGPETQPSPCVHQWSKTKGYRKIAGDSCVNDLPQFKGTVETCELPENGLVDKRGQSDHPWITFLLVCMLLALFTYFCIFERNAKIDSWVNRLLHNRKRDYVSLGDNHRSVSIDHDLSEDHDSVDGVSLNLQRYPQTSEFSKQPFKVKPNAMSFAPEHVNLIRETKVKNAKILSEMDDDNSEEEESTHFRDELGKKPGMSDAKLVDGNKWVLN